MTTYFELSFVKGVTPVTEIFIVKQTDNGLLTALVKANHLDQTAEEIQAVRNLLLNPADQQKWDAFVSRYGIENIAIIKK